MRDVTENSRSKVPEVTFAFWIVKILATTLGRDRCDAVTMSMNLGYLVGDGDLRGDLHHRRRCSNGREAISLRSCTGPSSSPRRPQAQRWPTLSIARWGLAISRIVPAGSIAHAVAWSLVSFASVRFHQQHQLHEG